MSSNTNHGLIVSFYLSKWNEKAYSALGYRNIGETHKVVGEILGIRHTTIRNWRDEFDPVHGHRIGWNKEPLRPGIKKVLEALSHLSEQTVRGIVKDILANRLSPEDDAKLTRLQNGEENGNETHNYFQRQETGAQAEDFFISHWKGMGIGDGNLEDCRRLGNGYDFLLSSDDVERFIEVKGIAEEKGGVLLTEKEWNLAEEKGDLYVLVVVYGLGVERFEGPQYRIIVDPIKNVRAERRLEVVLKASFSIPASEIF